MTSKGLSSNCAHHTKSPVFHTLTPGGKSAFTSLGKITVRSLGQTNLLAIRIEIRLRLIKARALVWVIDVLRGGNVDEPAPLPLLAIRPALL